MSSIQQTQKVTDQQGRDKVEETKVQQKPQQTVADIDKERKLKLLQGYQFSIFHSQLDIAQDVTCFINYSGPNIYKVAAHQIEGLLARHFPGMKTECNRLGVPESMIDIRLRKGVAGGDEFLHYIENINSKDLEACIAKETPVIVNKIDQELINMGFEFDFSICEQDKTKIQNKPKLPFLEEFMQEVEHKQKEKVMEGGIFNITHDKLCFETDVTTIIYWSGHHNYKVAAQKFEEMLKKHYPGMQVEIMRLHEENENMIDIRLRKGVTGGDEFILYLEDEGNQLSDLTPSFNKVIKKINNELLHMGFQFNFDLDENTIKLHKLLDELDEYAKKKAAEATKTAGTSTIGHFLKTKLPGIFDYFKEFQTNQTLKVLESKAFNITHEKLSLEKDVICIINYSGGTGYTKAVQKIEEYLKIHYPGMQIEVNKLADKEHIIDVRLRKGVSGGDEFIHYIEGVKSECLEGELAADLPQIVNKINLELINMGFRFNPKEEKNVEFPFKTTKEETSKMLANKWTSIIQGFLKKLAPGILNYLEEVQGWQKLKIMEGRSFNIKHVKLDISQDVTCLINYSGPDVYKVAAYRIDEWLHKHYPGMKIETMRLPEKEHMIDIRLRKGVTGGDEFLHYLENISTDNLETALATELPQIVNKINLELINMGFRFDFDHAKTKKEIEVPFHATKTQIKTTKE